MPKLMTRAHALAVRAATTRTGQRLRRPRLSVIVPFYNVEKYLADCLDSILSQGFRDFELLLVDDGSPDGSRAIAEQYVARDSRVRLLTRPNGGLGAARNTGVRAARGRYLTFIDSDDLLPPGALGALVAQADETGADIVAGAVERFDSQRRWQPSWVPSVHREKRVGVTVGEFPALLRNLYTWNKVYRRDFWQRQGLWFREGVAYEDQPIVTQLFIAAERIDVIPDLVYLYRARDDKSSISQQTASLKDLRDRIEAWRVSEEAFGQDKSSPIWQAWLATLFDAHFHWYLTSRGTADDDYWNELVAAVRHYSDQAEQWVWDRTMPPQRVLIELARRDRRDDAQELVRRDHSRITLWPTEVRDHGLMLLLPFHDDPELDEELFLLRPEQLSMAHVVENLHWVEEGGRHTCEVSGWALVRKLDLAHTDAVTSLVLRNERTGAEQVHVASGHPSPCLPPPVDDVWSDSRNGTFLVRFDVDELTAGARDGDEWSVHLRIEAGKFAVEGPVTRLLRSGAAGAVPALHLDSATRLRCNWTFRRPLRLAYDTSGVPMRAVGIEGRTLHGEVADASVTSVEVVCGEETASGRVSGGRFAVELPATRALPHGELREWRVLAHGKESGPRRLVPDPHTVAEPAPGARLVVDTNRNGELVVQEFSRVAEAVDAEVREDGGIVVHGRLLGSAGGRVRLRTTLHAQESFGLWADVVDGRFEATHDLRHDYFRFGRLPLPVGEHDLHLELEAQPGEWLTVEIGDELSAQLPVRIDTAAHEGNLLRGPGGGLRVGLLRPIREDRGKYAQRLLQEQGSSRPGLTHGILFRAYFGERATDNGLSIQAELARRGSDLPVYWAVQHHGIPVPEGGIPVVVNTREWYDLIGSVKYFVDNMFQPQYLRKREGQVYVQTFHGYPFKVMGRTHWQQQQFSQAKIDAYDERAAEWDHLVSPARYATPLLQREFNYHGDVLEIGYPRNDVLFSPQRDQLREVVRRSLGIRPDQKVVLYAPTFRDYLSENDQSALMVDFFDFEAAHRALGDDWVILIRGHAFNARTRLRAGAQPGCIDVTDYPEVSDLYLASDAAIADYSSLRFDYGVTGKPMVFHVPDLQRYKDTRGWLFDYEPTAPGPLVDTTEEVVAHLRDLDALRSTFAPAYERFRADYLDLEDGRAGERFVDAVIASRGDA